MAAVPGVRRSELGDALRACRNAFVGVGVMSCMINLLYLTGSLFMLEVYDRVLPSRSVPTLIGLAILAGGMYIAQGILDLIRARILGRIGTALDESLNSRVFETVVRLPLIVGARNDGPSAAARSRQCSLVSFRHGARRVLRSAVAAVLSGDLFCFPRHDRPDGAGRRDHPGQPHRRHRVHVARAGARRDGSGGAPQRSGRHQPAKCRSAGRDGNVRTPDPALERGQPELSRRQSARQRRRGRAWRDRQGPAHDAAIGGARCRRLSGDPSGGDRGHHHRGLDPERAGAGAGRSGDRALEEFRRRAPELASPQPPARAVARASGADAAAETRRAALRSRRSASCRRATRG